MLVMLFLLLAGGAALLLLLVQDQLVSVLSRLVQRGLGSNILFLSVALAVGLSVTLGLLFRRAYSLN